MIIYYNSRCRKCREALSLLQDEGCQVEIRNYLKEIPTLAEMRQLVKLLGCKAEQLIRKEEAIFMPFIDKKLSDLQALKLMVKHPVLIQRPIVVSDNRAVIGRPPALVLNLLLKSSKQK